MTDHSPVLREHGYHTLRIKSVVPETHDASSFVLEVPDELAESFRYRSGQFCTFRVHVDGEQLRSYSMSSAPEIDDDLTVTVKRVAGGLVSNWFLDRLDVGDVVEATKPESCALASSAWKRRKASSYAAISTPGDGRCEKT